MCLGNRWPLLSPLFYLHTAGQQTVKCVPSRCCWLYCLSQFRAWSERLSSMDGNEKPHDSAKSNRDSIYWNPCRDSISLAYRHWVWFSECYPYVTPPFTCSLSPFHKTACAPPPSLLNPLLPCLCTCCCEQQDPSVCFCSSLAFLPALTTPSLHPFLSCVLCCQAQLDQACQSSHMQPLLVRKQAVLNYRW